MRPASFACLLLSALLCGCTSTKYLPGGEPLARIRPQYAGEMEVAPCPGDYGLFRGDAEEPIETRTLKSNVPVGFQKAEDGRVLAWAGDEVIPLESGDYRWHLMPATAGQRMKDFAGNCSVHVDPTAAAVWGTLFRVTVLPLYCLCVNGRLEP